MRVWPLFVGLMALALGFVSRGVNANDSPPAPNIVVILVDDLRWDELGCTGHPFARTPHIDRIAHEGARFRNAFCNTPLCSPSRATLLTGLYTHHHGILENTNRGEQSHRLATFPQQLQQAGYDTAYVGKWHMGNDDSPRPGFDHWVSMKGQGKSFDPELNVNGKAAQGRGHTTDVLNAYALEFVRQARQKPFCLYVAHKALHPELVQFDDGSISDPSAARFLPAKRHAEWYADDAIPRRLNVLDNLQGKPALQQPIKGLPPLSRATGTDDETVRDRLRMLAAVDDGVGQLLDELKKQQQLDNTLFIFTSDHGYWYGEHGLSVERRLAYEEGIRIPLLVRYPPLVAAGTLIDDFAAAVDLAPTALDMSGLDVPDALDGCSLKPVLEGKTPSDWRDAVLIEYFSDTVFPRLNQLGYQAVRTARWKYIHYVDQKGMDELYDMKQDPYEMTNVIDTPDAARVVQEMQSRLASLLEKKTDATAKLDRGKEAQVEVKAQLNVDVPMRDGTVLKADIYRPAGDGEYPVLVMRTPYGKTGNFNELAQAGYIVVVQDARGRYASGGKWESFVRHETHDAEDGYDTVEWAAKLPGSNGKVGTFGNSYNAFLQWRLAPLRPPSLVAMAAFSIPARYTDLEGPGTIRPGRRLHWWNVAMSPDMRAKNGRPGTTVRADAQAAWDNGGRDKWLNFLPYGDLPREVFEDEGPAVRAWLRAPHQDPWKLHEGVPQITVPNLNIVGWWDHCNGRLMLDEAIRHEAGCEVAKQGSRTIIGPWSHAGLGQRSYGNIDFGMAAEMSLTEEQIRWFDYWLKGKQNGVGDAASYRIFVMGDNRWRDEPAWPPADAKPKSLYLSSDGAPNTPRGGGKLLDAAEKQEGTGRYYYHPDDPVPSLHGDALFQIPTDQRPLADRQDILVYQTEPLKERLEVTGVPEVVLYASSSAPDTDFFVRLIDVAPDGLARDVSLGMVRARYREGLENPKPLVLGEPVKYTIRMNPTSNAFLPGHRVRLDITSSDFPNYARNHNTALDQNADATLQGAHQRIHWGGDRATRLVLPVISNDARD